MKKLLNTALLLFAVLMTSCTAPDAWELASKDSNIRFALENKQENGGTTLSYSVFYKDGVAMEKSLLGLVMDNCEYGKDVYKRQVLRYMMHSVGAFRLFTIMYSRFIQMSIIRIGEDLFPM